MNSKLYTTADIVEKEGKIEGIASTSVMDRQNESVSVEGWDLKNFKKAPRLLWAHDHNEPAIGKVTKLFFEGEGKRKSLKFEAIFQEVTEKARAIKKLVEDGFINTFSVGFKPLEIDGDTITKQELLEISVVNVPANPEAMLLAVKSLEKAGFEKAVIDEVIDQPDTDRLENMIKEAIDIAKAAEKKAELAVQGLKHLNPQKSKAEATATRLSLSKVIARSADKLLEGKPEPQTASMLKIIKRSSDTLIRSHKGDLL